MKNKIPTTTFVSPIRKLAKSSDINVLKIKTERNNLGALKTFLVLLLIAVQFVVFFVSYLYLIWLFQSFFVISFVFSLITCIYVLSTNKNSQSKPIWILFLLLFFGFGYIIYLISDERFFWHKHKKQYNKILQKSNAHVPTSAITTKNISVKNDCNYLQSAGNFVSYTNTDTKYFSSGTKLFDSILKDLKNARQFIFIEYFIISDGVLLERFFNILKQKVQQGVDVRIIYDDLGSHGTFKRKTKKLIKQSGIKLFAFNKLLPRFNALLNYRDHRKIVVIDGKVAYTGGANLADEYINEKRTHGYWKDAGIRIEGAGVDGFSLIFLRQWEFVTKQPVEFEKHLNKYTNTNNTSLIVPYADGLEYSDNIGKNTYLNMIANANKKLYIMSPYFIIDDTIKNVLINKAKSGVDIRIILPDIADKKFVYVISRNNAEKLLQYGIKVYTIKNSFVHSKVMLNEHSAIVGSINMDLRSFYQQFESAVYLNDQQTMAQIEDDFKAVFNTCTQINEKNLKRNRLSFRIIAGIMNIISPFM